jgi:hypothetical protein
MQQRSIFVRVTFEKAKACQIWKKLMKNSGAMPIRVTFPIQRERSPHQYHNGAGFNVGCLGAWPDGEAFGVSVEKCQSTAEGRALQAEFNALIDCSGRHELAASLPINSSDCIPKDGVVTFYQCSLKDGKTLSHAYTAHLATGTAMKAMGSMGLSWMFQPALGAGDIDFDYYHVVAFYRYSDMGITMEMFANGGGNQKQTSFLSPVASCETPTVFDALSVRAADER